MTKLTLSFDIEEFDTPLEYGATIDFATQMSISIDGTEKILDILKKHNVKCTFFCTANFANHAEYLIHRIINEGHELASHGFYHTTFAKEDLLASRLRLEELSGQKIVGYRMARMMPVSNQDLVNAGYIYNASLHPTYIPGRYNNFSKPRLIFKEDNLIQVPASVTPIIRIPLFWLSFHNFPFSFYRACLNRVLKKDKWANIYFHPWEFTDISAPELALPSIIKRNSADKMCSRLDKLIDLLRKENVGFVTYQSHLNL